MTLDLDLQTKWSIGNKSTLVIQLPVFLNGKTILCVYPKGHGRGEIVYKKSIDSGLTWSDRLPTPINWQEVPTLHIGPDGKKRIIMLVYPSRLAVSEDDGGNWSPLKEAGDWGGIVVMGFVESVGLKKGHYLAMFHDERFYAKNGKKTGIFTLFKTFSEDGGLTWKKPEEVFKSGEVHLCEPGFIRSPDGKRIAVLLRENSRRKNSHIIFQKTKVKHGHLHENCLFL